MVFPGFASLIRKIPGGQNVQVFCGTVFLLGLSAVPLIIERDTKRGHELFSSEKPLAIEKHQEQMMAKAREGQN